MYDVIVAGGGTAGAVSAITCAKLGLKTLVVEELSFLGGSQTGALVTPMMSALVKDEPSFGKVNKEIIDMLEKTGNGNDLWFNPEELKSVLEELYIGYGGEILYLSKIIEVVKEDKTVKGIKIANKNGIEEKFAKFIIDATGDADIAALAGIPFELGRGSENKCQPVSLRFEAANVDLKCFSEYLKSLGQTNDEQSLEAKTFYGAHTVEAKWPLTPVFEKGIKDGDITFDDSRYFQFFAIPGKPNALAFNCPEIFTCKNPTKQEDISSALTEGRRAISRLIKFMKKNFNGFENAYIGASATMLGVRDSRRISGDYLLSSEDLAAYKKFDDAIAKCNYYIDVHGLPEDEKTRIEQLRLQSNCNENEKYYTIPFRSCVPKEYDGLLVAGRSISADFLAQAAIRIQLVCRAVGEACAYAAFLAIKEDKKIREIDYKAVSNYMLEKNKLK